MPTKNTALSTNRFPILPLALVGLILLLTGWLLAMLGYWLLLPPPPWGDEAQHRLDMMTQAWRLVLMPWEVSVGEDVALLLHIARQTLTLLGLGIISISGYWWLQNPLRVWRIQRQGGHIVLWGTGRMGAAVLRDQLSRKSPVILVSQPPFQPWIQPGVGVISPRQDGEQLWISAGLANAKAMIAVADDDQESFQATLQADKFLQKRPSLRALSLSAHLADDALRRSLERDLGIRSPSGKRSLRLFSLAKASARLLFKAAPPDRFRSLNDPSRNHILILGAGEWGREIGLLFLRLAHFRHGHPPDITFVDRRADAETEFFDHYPQAGLVGQVTFHRLDVQSESGMTRLLEEMVVAHSPIAIYVCLGNAASSVSAAIQVERILRRMLQFIPPISVRLEQPGLLREMLDTDQENLQGGGMIRPFGFLDEIFSHEMLLLEEVDQVARLLHQRYYQECLERGEPSGSRPAVVPWEELPEVFKEDNRLVADHLAIKLRDLHCRSVPGLSPNEQRFTEQEVDEVGRAEHHRWCANRWLNNWKYAPQRQDQNRLHHNLVPFDDLSQEDQEKDRQIVRVDLANTMNALGAPIRREWPVAVWADGAANLLTAVQSASIREFLEQRPPVGAVPVLTAPL
ncbi:MAG: NAD-binding protein, partial [Magnetococcales bacterium]|nr:NAD-binding protein [Magnetococcales bacterium]